MNVLFQERALIVVQCQIYFQYPFVKLEYTHKKWKKKTEKKQTFPMRLTNDFWTEWWTLAIVGMKEEEEENGTWIFFWEKSVQFCETQNEKRNMKINKNQEEPWRD